MKKREKVSLKTGDVGICENSSAFAFWHLFWEDKTEAIIFTHSHKLLTQLPVGFVMLQPWMQSENILTFYWSRTRLELLGSPCCQCTNHCATASAHSARTAAGYDHWWADRQPADVHTPDQQMLYSSKNIHHHTRLWFFKAILSPDVFGLVICCCQWETDLCQKHKCIYTVQRVYTYSQLPPHTSPPPPSKPPKQGLCSSCRLIEETSQSCLHCGQRPDSQPCMLPIAQLNVYYMENLPKLQPAITQNCV